MLIPTKFALDLWIADMTADSPGLGSASIGLIAANLTPTANTKLSNIVEANYTGYARKSKGAWGATFTDPSGLESQEGSLLSFVPSDTVTVNTIYGLFITGSDSTKLIGCEMFNAPIALTGPSTQITIIPRVGASPSAPWGFSVIAP